MEVEKIKIFAFICTRSDVLSETTSNLLSYLYSCGVKVNLLVNKASIFDAYSSALKQNSHLIQKDDILLFCHDDIEIFNDPKHFINTLVQETDPKMSGFIGPAGTKHLDKDAIWWNHTLWSAGMHRGLVFHGKNKLETTYYGPYGQVVVLDGLFLACRARILTDIKLEKPVFFNGEWDFYDIWYTYQAHTKGYKNKTAPILLRHESFGELAGRDSWHKNRESFISIAKLPIYV